jgi:opacity protein-like surface antigen
MIRFSILTIAVSLLASSLLLAQDETPKVQVFGGFTLFHQDNGEANSTNINALLRVPGFSLRPVTNFKGWNAEAQYNVDRWLGIVVDFGGRYGAPFNSSSINKVSGFPDSTGYSVLAGPVISYRTESRFTPYIHAMLGVDRTTLKGSTISGLPTPVTTTSSTYNDVAYAAGAGVDFKLSQHFAIRLGQVDYFRTTINVNKLYQGAFGPALLAGSATKQGNLRFSTGFVIQF